jgi:adenosylcobinamide-phosphate synthase
VAAGLVLGVLADDIFGDPKRNHPVAGFGAIASKLESRLYADTVGAGAAFWACSVLPVLGAAITAEWMVSRRPVTRAVLVAAATWTVLGGRSLRTTGSRMARCLGAGDTAAARDQVRSLCGRDPDSLDQTGLTRATIESLAENTSDSVVGPLVWGAVAGLPGLLGYRAVNTLDAMVGHRSSRYNRFGSVSARVDDVANLAPSRLSAALTVLNAPRVAGSPAAAWTAWRADGSTHPSPNAGQCEASMAGALGISLGGPTVYGSRTENRPVLGAGGAPALSDIERAVRLSRLIQHSALAVAVAGVVVSNLRAQRSRRRGRRRIHHGVPR